MTLIKGLWPGTMRCLTMADHVFMSRIESPHTTAPTPTHSLCRSFIAFSLLRTTQERTLSAILSVCRVACVCVCIFYVRVCFADSSFQLFRTAHLFVSGSHTHCSVDATNTYTPKLCTIALHETRRPHFSNQVRQDVMWRTGPY